MAAIRILLVEDEGLIRMMTAEFLQEEGFEVVEALDGDEAVSILDRHASFDVLFTDVQMPGRLDGIDVAEHARRRDFSIPVLVVSGYTPKLVNRLAVLDPTAAFISKPYMMDQIVDALRRLAAKS